MDKVALMLPTTPGEPPNGEYEFVDRTRPIIGTDHQLRASYPNGYGASVIRSRFSYGGENGLFELAVKHNGHLCYATSITSDVLGWLTEEDVIATLHKIAALSSNPLCVHRPRSLLEDETPSVDADDL